MHGLYKMNLARLQYRDVIVVTAFPWCHRPKLRPVI